MSVKSAQYPGWDGLSANSQRTDRNADVEPNFQDWDQLVAEVLAHQAAIGGGGGGGGDLLAANNLSDLDDAAAARTNLDVYSTAEVDAAVAGAGGGTSLEVTKTNDNAGSLVIGTPVYAKSNGNIDKAQADSLLTSEVLGLATGTIASAASGGVQTGGTLEATTAEWDAVTGETGGLSPGEIYFLDAASPGMLTQSAPTTNPNVRLRVGLAHSSTMLEIRIGEPIQL